MRALKLRFLHAQRCAIGVQRWMAHANAAAVPAVQLEVVDIENPLELNFILGKISTVSAPMHFR